MSSENIKTGKDLTDYESEVFLDLVYNSPKNLKYSTFNDSNITEILEQLLKK